MHIDAPLAAPPAAWRRNARQRQSHGAERPEHFRSGTSDADYRPGQHRRHACKRCSVGVARTHLVEAATPAREAPRGQRWELAASELATPLGSWPPTGLPTGLREEVCLRAIRTPREHRAHISVVPGGPRDK